MAILKAQPSSVLNFVTSTWMLSGVLRKALDLQIILKYLYPNFHLALRAPIVA